MAKQYDDVIDLTLGDPDIMPDDKIRAAAQFAIESGKIKVGKTGFRNWKRCFPDRIFLSIIFLTQTEPFSAIACNCMRLQPRQR